MQAPLIINRQAHTRLPSLHTVLLRSKCGAREVEAGEVTTEAAVEADIHILVALSHMAGAVALPGFSINRKDMAALAVAVLHMEARGETAMA